MMKSQTLVNKGLKQSAGRRSAKIKAKLANIPSTAKTTSPYLQLLEALMQIDDILDVLRESVRSLSTLPFFKSFPLVKKVIEVLDRVEDVLDSLPLIED